MKKYIIIDPESGIFLGTAKNDELELLDVPPGTKIVALFSSNNVFEITKAVAFFTKEDAEEYINIYIKRRCPYAFVGEIESSDDESNYVDIVDIVKAGYGDHAWDMIDYLPLISDSLH